MKATNDGADIVQRQIDLMRNKYPNFKINLLFGRYLLDMNHLAKAESYFQMLLHELECSNSEQHYHEDLAYINNSLGELNIRTTNYQKAYKYFKTAYTIRSEYNTTTNTFTSYIFFGNYYKAIGDHQVARNYYMNALLNINQDATINIGRLKINIACINEVAENYNESLKLCLEIETLFKKIQPKYVSHFENDYLSWSSR